MSESDSAPIGFVSLDMLLESIRVVIAVELSPGFLRFPLGVELSLSIVVVVVSALTDAAVPSQINGVCVLSDWNNLSSNSRLSWSLRSVLAVTSSILALFSVFVTIVFFIRDLVVDSDLFFVEFPVLF